MVINLIRFEKVSLEEYAKARFKLSHKGEVPDDYIEQYREEWENIKLPKRATKKSAGYDFFAPFDFELTSIWNKKEKERSEMYYKTIPTGIRICSDDGDLWNWFLLCVPRSGLGFKNKVRLANTCGVIDADYQNSDNEGHIMLKISSEDDIKIEKGKGIMQGIIVPFVTAVEDDISEDRNGGFGSTDK